MSQRCEVPAATHRVTVVLCCAPRGCHACGVVVQHLLMSHEAEAADTEEAQPGSDTGEGVVDAARVEREKELLKELFRCVSASVCTACALRL